jgi:hypothetical protein
MDMILFKIIINTLGNLFVILRGGAMSNAKLSKLQCLLITQLLEQGSVQLILPNGVKLDIGILQEDQYGQSKKADDYCYVVASKYGKAAMLDSYNIGLIFEAEKDVIIYEDEILNKEGKLIKTLDVI